MTWVGDNLGLIWDQLSEHIYLAILPVVFGLLIALPLGYVATRFSWLANPLIALGGVLYSLPSIALFIVLPVVLGTQVLDPVNIVVALTIYTVALLIRNVIDGLRSVPPDVRQAAIAVGFGPARRLLTIDLPIAVPVIFAGLRVATVANISMVSVGAVIGIGGLGELFTQGFQKDFLTPVVVGVVLSLLLALLADLLIVGLQRVLTPWARVVSPVKAA
ncbi:osmoprotectant transport system permease protein [Kribbella orskensis]|uniref:Osmoprotectant transport system permease protein n=1 Tax=Kribbella orskensis TaxID=2512216 RepID=A0ABY2B8A8_9ACTN|nr:MULTISPECIES: ABC transporter permease [Kribbella]TCM51184.1 osmoprotectant transport system permease protein [Kribbella sp. VKM Ac-2568]TCN28566.1 osmoprotectant transport system permease protein [Kribbella sp. VKM Ac-2500]TCO08517.1 osmoprotectant transport system permease protein [Kribbella orskensis]